MACAKESPALLLSRRLNRVAVLAGVGPIADPGYVGYKDMRCETRWLLKGAYRFPGLVRACLNTFVVPRALHPDPEAWWRHMMAQLEYAKESERELLVKDSEAFALLLRITREHFRQGGGAFMDEAALVMRPWGFALDEVAFGREGDEGRITFCCSARDRNTPVSMARAMVRRLPNARLKVWEDESHLDLFDEHGEEALTHLLV